MTLTKLRNFTINLIQIKSKRLVLTVVAYLIFLMSSQRKHTLTAAAQMANCSVSRFSKFLKNHQELAVYTLNSLSRKQSKMFSRSLKDIKELPWKIAILIDATLQNRSSLHPYNSKRFNHGKGYHIGHQWTNIVLFINEFIIPLPPIPYYSKKYCRENKLKYKTEPTRVIEYLNDLDLNEYLTVYDPYDVVVMGDSGYDNKALEKAILNKGWDFVVALKKNRTVKTVKAYENTAKSKDWLQIMALFKNHRHVKWQTVQVSNKNIKKRMEFRARQIIGYLRNVGKVKLVCSEIRSKKLKGCRKHLACSNLDVSVRQIIFAYRIRWSIEIFHKHIKMFFGFEDVSTLHFESVISHVHWVYCAYILLCYSLPGILGESDSPAEKQLIIDSLIIKNQLSTMRQILTRFKGPQTLKTLITLQRNLS